MAVMKCTFHWEHKQFQQTINSINIGYHQLSTTLNKNQYSQVFDFPWLYKFSLFSTSGSFWRTRQSHRVSTESVVCHLPSHETQGIDQDIKASSNVKSWETNFTATWCMFKFSLRISQLIPITWQSWWAVWWWSSWMSSLIFYPRFLAFY